MDGGKPKKHWKNNHKNKTFGMTKVSKVSRMKLSLNVALPCAEQDVIDLYVVNPFWYFVHYMQMVISDLLSHTRNSN